MAYRREVRRHGSSGRRPWMADARRRDTNSILRCGSSSKKRVPPDHVAGGHADGVAIDGKGGGLAIKNLKAGRISEHLYMLRRFELN